MSYDVVIRFFRAAAVLSVFTLLVSCWGSGGGGNSAKSEDTQHSPQITDVRLYNANDTAHPWDHPASKYNVDDYINAQVDASDDDLDMKTAWVTEYYPADATTPDGDPYQVNLQSQNGTDMTYYLLDSLQITEPFGNYRLETYIVDAQGHKSNTFTIYYSVE